MTREEKKEELVGLFAAGAIFIGDLIDECFEFGQQHPRWISVEDELPKKYDSYLTCTSGNVIEITHYNIDGWHTESRGEVTHWMPLPQAPKKGGEQ